jgi:hypothetical protein
MKDIRYLLLQSQGTPLATLIQKGLVSDWARSLISNRATKISVHYDRAAHRALKQAGSHACCLGDKIFLGPAIGTSTGPRFSEVLHHELVHTAQIERSRRTGGGSSLQQIEEEVSFAKARSCLVMKRKVRPISPARSSLQHSG